MSDLLHREGRTYQFEFLKPTHSMFSVFNSLVEQYTTILHSHADALFTFKERLLQGARATALLDGRQYARWHRMKSEEQRQRQDHIEAERSELNGTRTTHGLMLPLDSVAFAEIDWHDYAIVQTIEFTLADVHAELPAPMSVQEVENMTLTQKRMAAVIMEDTAEDIEAHRKRQVAAIISSDAEVLEGEAGMAENDTSLDLRQIDVEEQMKTLEQARVIQAATSISGPMKVVTDYTPKGNILLLTKSSTDGVT